MKTINWIGVMLLVFGFCVTEAQTGSQNKNKKQQSSDQQSGGATGTSESRGDTEGESTGNAEQGALGDDNDKAREDAGQQNSRSNYRNNKVTGNPNNRSVDEGSNNRSSSAPSSDESSTAAPSGNGSAGAGTSGQNAGDNNATGSNSDSGASGTSQGGAGGSAGGSAMGTSPGGSTVTGTNSAGAAAGPPETQVNTATGVLQETSTQSGSPAVLSEEKGTERDGTNNVQKANPNMVGSPARGLNRGNKSIDEDEEIRKGTSQQQGVSSAAQVDPDQEQQVPGRQKQSRNISRSNPDKKVRAGGSTQKRNSSSPGNGSGTSTSQGNRNPAETGTDDPTSNNAKTKPPGQDPQPVTPAMDKNPKPQNEETVAQTKDEPKLKRRDRKKKRNRD